MHDQAQPPRPGSRSRPDSAAWPWRRLGAFLAAQGSLAPTLLPMLVLLAIAAFLPVSEIAQVGRQLADTIASTRRLRVVEREGSRASTDGQREPARPEAGSTLRFEGVRFTYPSRTRPALDGIDLHLARRAHGGARRALGRGQVHRRQCCCCVSGTRRRAASCSMAPTSRDLSLAGLRQRVALVAQDTYLFNDLGSQYPPGSPQGE